MLEDAHHAKTLDGGEQAEPERLAGALLAAAHRLRKRPEVRLSAAGSGDGRFAALTVIARSAPEGCSQAELAAALAQSQSSVSGLVRRMRKDGLLYRLRPKRDQRRCALLLSQRGREVLAEIEQKRARLLRELLDGFDPRAQQRLAELLQRLAAHLEGADGRSAPADPASGAASPPPAMPDSA